MRRRTVGVIGAAALAVPFMAAAAFGAPGGQRAAVAGTTPSWAEASRAVGAPSGSARISFNVELSLRDSAGAEAALRAVSTPHGKSYGKYLSASSFNATYGPTDASVAKVRDFLTGAGFTVGGVAAGNRWVTASGTVAQIDRAFATTMRTYEFKGQHRQAPATTLSVPSSIRADVLAVSGLTQSLAHTNVSKPDTGTAPKTAKAPAAAPTGPAGCSGYWGQQRQTMPEAFGQTSFPTYICGYSPKQLRGAYNVQSAVSAGTNGHGVSVAIIDAYDSPTILADANAYSAAFGEPGFAAGQFIDTSNPANWTMQDECGSWADEESLDVEAVHAMAPNATVHYFGADNCGDGIDAAFNTVVQTHGADMISNSYGYGTEELDPAQIQAEHSMFLQAGLEGIGVYFSSGDDGDNALIDGVDAPEPSLSSSDPLVTGVGGTSLGVLPSNGYEFETGWGTTRDFVDYTGANGVYESPLPGDFYGGAGGGVSTVFSQPWYQKGTVPTKLAKSRGGAAMRVDPDIAALADPYTGFAYGITVDGTFQIGGIGGTSLACPLIAGIQADASTNRHVPIGFANPLLYLIGGFTTHDVKPPKSPVAVARSGASALVVMDHDTTLKTAKGYDDVTGIGTPKGSLFILAESVL